MTIRNLSKFFVVIFFFSLFLGFVKPASALAPLCNLNYSAGEGGTVDGSEYVLVRTIRGGTGRQVRAMAAPGYAFVDWDDGLTTANRSDVCLGGGLFFTANFRRVRIANYLFPIGVGAGSNNRIVAMDDRGFVGVADQAGINVFMYLNSQAEFEIIASQSGLPERHEMQILDLDMNTKKIKVQFASDPQIFEMALGDGLKIDLDGDKIADILAKYQDLVINRVEMTLSSADSTIIADAASCSTCGSVVEPILEKYMFSRDLYFNVTGLDVKELQRFLNSHGFVVAASGAGSLGNETENFGSLTKQALVKFQLKNGITPAVGYFGPITRGIVNSLNK